MKHSFFVSLALTTVLFSCKSSTMDSDAAGSFESVETIISTEASGILMQFNVEEGQSLKVGQWVGYVDSIQLYLKKKQLEAQITSTLGQKPDIPVQIASLQTQLQEAEKNQTRTLNLFKAGASTQQQLDDINSNVETIKKQIEAQRSSLGITSNTLNRETAPLQRQIDQLNDQLVKCRVVNPVNGTVLSKYAQAHEVANPGKALYKIAATDTLILRAYITGTQISQVRLGQKVTVQIDDGEKKFRNYPGVIYWVSDKSEFTPKTIPTKEERADLVYAIKVRVPNDGYIKIGMYGQMKL